MELGNPYFIDEPAVISLSGGRTSGYMLYKILEAHGGLPDWIKVVFANTGKEMPQTLDFLRDIGERWGVEIIWLERISHRIKNPTGRRKFWYEIRIVNYETASRKGEPFENLIHCRTILPNPITRYCTVELKIRCITQFAAEVGLESPYTAVIGIRADEPRRAAKIHMTVADGQERYCPLYIDGVTAADVGKFWEQQNFDLALPNNRGVTDWGNCDLCFLKGQGKKISIIRERPDLADWWIEQENYMTTHSAQNLAISKDTATFRKDGRNYKEMKDVASQATLFDLPDDETIPCFCGD